MQLLDRPGQLYMDELLCAQRGRKRRSTGEKLVNGAHIQDEGPSPGGKPRWP